MCGSDRAVLFNGGRRVIPTTFKDRVCEAQKWAQQTFSDRALWAALPLTRRLMAGFLWPLRRSVFAEDYRLIEALAMLSSRRALADEVNAWRATGPLRVSRGRLLALDAAAPSSRTKPK